MFLMERVLKDLAGKYLYFGLCVLYDKCKLLPCTHEDINVAPIYLLTAVAVLYSCRGSFFKACFCVRRSD
jgi:hypothetical protein